MYVAHYPWIQHNMEQYKQLSHVNSKKKKGLRKELQKLWLAMRITAWLWYILYDIAMIEIMVYYTVFVVEVFHQFLDLDSMVSSCSFHELGLLWQLPEFVRKHYSLKTGGMLGYHFVHLEHVAFQWTPLGVLAKLSR